MFPELGPCTGYAVTCVYGLPDPDYNKYTFMDVGEVLDSSKKPTILVIKQNFPSELKDL